MCIIEQKAYDMMECGSEKQTQSSRRALISSILASKMMRARAPRRNHVILYSTGIISHTNERTRAELV